MPWRGSDHLIVKTVAVVVAIVLSAISSQGEAAELTLVKKIGVANSQSINWTSFVSFSPDGRMVVSDRDDRDGSSSFSFWSFPSGRLIKTEHGNLKALSKNWRYYLSNDSVVERKTGKSVMTVATGASGEFSQRGNYFAELLPDKDSHGPKIRIIKVAGAIQVSVFDSHPPFSVAFSPDDKTIAAGHWDSVKLWNARTGKRLAVLRGFGRYVTSIAFSPDGKRLAAGTDFGGMKIWDVRRHRLLYSIKLDGQYVSTPAFTPDGKKLAVGTYGSGTAWLINVDTGKIADHVKVSDLGCGSTAFSPDGRYLITPSTGGLITWPYDEPGAIRVFRLNYDGK